MSVSEGKSKDAKKSSQHVLSTINEFLAFPGLSVPSLKLEM